MNKDFKPGTKVFASVDDDEYDGGDIIKFIFDEYDDYTLVGEVMDKPASEDHVWVKWEENDHVFDDEMEVETALLTLACDIPSIEQDFKTYQKEIKEKMKEAAKLVKEAGKLAEKAHAKSLESMYEACRPLVNAMDQNGWRSSSWGC